jgi:hypothetical protein
MAIVVGYPGAPRAIDGGVVLGGRGICFDIPDDGVIGF